MIRFVQVLSKGVQYGKSEDVRLISKNRRLCTIYFTLKSAIRK